MSIDFAYGRGHLVVDMPEAAEVTVIRKSPLAKSLMFGAPCGL